MRPAASAYSVSAYLQPQFATPNTRCLIFYTYPLSFLEAKWFLLDPQTTPPPKKTQTQNCPLQPSDARSVCLAPVFFQLPTHHMNRHNTTGPKTPILEWEGGGRKTQIANETRASTKRSLSLYHLFSQRRNSYATKTRSPKLKFVSDHFLQNCKSI
jgi:hypothetical protein